MQRHLREAAIKNAEQEVLEKYSGEIKKAVSTLLEQEEEDPFAAKMKWALVMRARKIVKALSIK